ncbi:MAG TPA: response regulator [Nitrososphaeraceae archaeon]|jgi:CheY-like chemotaxis protein/predicted transcriptional regulator
MAENIGSFSFDVTKRILCTLYNDGSIKKTALATKTRLNYNVCLRYIKMLNVLGWVEVSSDVSITESGRNVMKRLLNQPATSMDSDQTYDLDQGSPERVTKSISNQAKLISSSKFDNASYNPNIMIVDDEPDVLLTYESFLTDAGFNVSTFAESYQALKAFVSKPSLYDLIILDIRMENLNGLQLYQSMKAMNPTSKIIFASALDAAKELTSVLPEINSQDLIKKPVDRDNFIKAIKVALST